jgi:hypothetical protein
MRPLLLLLVLIACKGKQQDQDRKPAEGSAALDIAACEKALDQAAAAPLAARPKIVIDGCPVCGGGWAPLLKWNVEAASGGPRREDIERTMVDCEAFCTGDSKLKFIAGVDKARGHNVNTPWRQLATACGTKVNAAPDDRFMSAPFFALDRIARKVTALGGAPAQKLAALELPLPAISFGGSGVVLPDSDGVTPSTGELQITILGELIHVGRMPRAKLGAAGVLVDLREGYPGEPVKLDTLGAKLGELVGDDKTQTITILAPHAMPAVNLVPIIAAASAVAPVYLGANAYDSPEGWSLVGAIPIALEAGNGVEVTDEMTVQNLARELAGHAARKQHRIGVTKK